MGNAFFGDIFGMVLRKFLNFQGIFVKILPIGGHF